MWTTVQAHIPRPLRMRHRLQVAAHCRVRAAHSRMRITITRARCRHIHGENQRRTTRCFCSLQRVTHKAAIAQYIKLEPHWALDGWRDFFNRANGNRRESKRNAMRIRRFGSLNFAASRIHATQTYRTQRHRHRQFLIKQRRFQA